MRMVVTLRNGVQIKQRVTKYEARFADGTLTALDFTMEPASLADAMIRYLDTREVVAVHTEYEPSDA